jgi:hypothetical protein
MGRAAVCGQKKTIKNSALSFGILVARSMEYLCFAIAANINPKGD